MDVSEISKMPLVASSETNSWASRRASAGSPSKAGRTLFHNRGEMAVPCHRRRGFKNSSD